MGIFIKKIRVPGSLLVATMLLLLMSPRMVRASDTELVMFGTRSCVYCQLFNRDVAPGYHRSKFARLAPLKEILVERQGTGGYALRGGGISVTPTFVMFRHGREVARIRGYPGKKNFYRMVRQILRRIRP